MCLHDPTNGTDCSQVLLVGMSSRIESRTWSSSTLLRGLSLVYKGNVDLGNIHGMADADVDAMEQELRQLEAWWVGR